MECSVCYTESRKTVMCPACSYVACKDCQARRIQDMKVAECMNCRCTFTRKFLTDAMGKTYVSREFKAIEQDALLEQERLLLPSTQPLVDWEREYRRQKSLVRFGHPMRIPPRPQFVAVTATDFFPCPAHECRGFVERRLGFTCGTCHVQACHMCRELRTGEHACDPGVLSNLALIMRDSKACPRCGVMINRSQGCDHMFCTHCRTHFHYVTGKILQQSTNGHYNNLQAYRQDVAVRADADGAGAGAAREGAACNGFIDVAHNVGVPHAQTPRAVLRTLFEDVDKIRFILDRMYNITHLRARHDAERSNMRVQFLMGELTEERWKSRLYIQHKCMERDTLIHNVLRMYLECVLRFQAEQQLLDADVVLGCCRAANEAFRSVAEEFGMSRTPRIREPTDPDDVPAILN